MSFDEFSNAALVEDAPMMNGHHDQGGVVLPLYRALVPMAPQAPAVTDAVYIRDRHGLQRVERSSIRMLSAEGNYLEIHTADRRFVLRNSMREVMQQLGDHRFVQVNRHTAVNIDRLIRVDCDSVELDGQCVTLSRNFRSNLLDHLQVLSGR